MDRVFFFFFLPVSILQLKDTTLAFRSESVPCHWNATYYHSAVKSGSIQARLRGVEWAVRRTNPREALQIHQKWHSDRIVLISGVEELSATLDFMTLWILKGICDCGATSLNSRLVSRFIGSELIKLDLGVFEQSDEFLERWIFRRHSSVFANIVNS